MLSVIFLIIAALGAMFCYRGFVQLAHARRCEHWPSVVGEVVKSHVAEDFITGENDYTVYQARVEYHYTVGTRKYIGYRIAFWLDEQWGGEADAQAHVAARPPGKKLSVMYDPANPAQSTLEPGVYAKIYVYIGGSIMVILVAAGLYMAASRALNGAS